MAYRNTLEADALKLVAKKLQSSLAVDGELPGDGLAAYRDDGDDLMLAPTRQIFAHKAGEESVEDVFARAQQVAAEAEALLGGRRVERARAGGRRGQRRWRQRRRRGCRAQRSFFSAGTASLSASTNKSLSRARRQREIGRVRDLMENEPYASMLHMTFTFHATAAREIDTFWQQHRLPSFEDTPANQAAVVVLRGMRDDDQVEALLRAWLDAFRVDTWTGGEMVPRPSPPPAP